MREIIFCLCLVSTYTTWSQSLTPEGLITAGGSSGDGISHISWTIGDIQTATFTSADKTLILTQGLLQPDFKITGINQIIENDNIIVDVYPNPVKEILNLKFSSKLGVNLHFYLFSIDGKTLYSVNYNTAKKSAELNFKAFQHGYYILKILSEDQSFLRTYKILYQD